MLGKKSSKTDSIRARLEENLATAKAGLAAVNQREGDLHAREKEILQKLRRTSIEAKSADLADLDTPITAVDLADVEVRRLEEHLSAIRHAIIDIRETRRPHLEAVAGAENALREYEQSEGRAELARLLPGLMRELVNVYPAYQRANYGQYPNFLGFVKFLYGQWSEKQPSIPCYGGATRRPNEGGDDV